MLKFTRIRLKLIINNEVDLNLQLKKKLVLQLVRERNKIFHVEIFIGQTRFKPMWLTMICNGLKRTISASGGLELLQMMS